MFVFVLYEYASRKNVSKQIDIVSQENSVL